MRRFSGGMRLCSLPPLVAVLKLYFFDFGMCGHLKHGRFSSLFELAQIGDLLAHYESTIGLFRLRKAPVSEYRKQTQTLHSSGAEMRAIAGFANQPVFKLFRRN